MITKQKDQNQNQSITTFKTSSVEVITASNSMKIFGFSKNNRDWMDSHLNMVGDRISSILAEISPLLRFMGQKTRKEIVYSKAASLLIYGSELFTGLSEWIKNRYTAIMMRCNRCIYRKYWFKVSDRRICEDIAVDQPNQMCRKSTLRNFHKILWHKALP